MRDATDTEEAILEWINDLVHPEKVETLADVSNGRILYMIIRDVDPTFFSNVLPKHPSDESMIWFSKWQNLNFINKEIIAFVKQFRPTIGLDKSTWPDLKLIAAAEDVASLEAIKLLKLVLLVAFISDRAEEYRTRLKQLSPSTQDKINQVLEEAQRENSIEAQSDTMSRIEPTPTPSQEAPTSEELQTEAVLSKLRHANKDIRDQNDVLEEERLKLTATVADLQKEMLRATWRDPQPGIQGGEVGGGHSRTAEAGNDNLWGQLYAHDVEVSDDQQIRNLELASRKTENLQDEISILKKENEDLRRQANAAENYRKKLSQLKEVESEVQELRNKLEDAEIEVESAKKARMAAEVDSESCRKALETVEKTNYDLLLDKKRFEVDRNHLLGRWEHINEDRMEDTEQISGYQSKIAALESRLRDLEAERDAPGGPPRTLEDELKEEAEREAREAESGDDGDVDGDDNSGQPNGDQPNGGQPSPKDAQFKAVLQRQIDESNARVEEMRRRRDEALQEVARLEGLLRARPNFDSVQYNPLSSDAVNAAYREGISNERFMQIREFLRDAQTRERTATNEVSRLEAELLRTRTDLKIVRGEFDLLNQDRLNEAYINFELNFPAFLELRAERDQLYQLHENLRKSNGILNGILTDVLLDKDVVNTSMLHQTHRVHEVEGVERDLVTLARGLEEDQASYRQLREKDASEADGASSSHAATRPRPPISPHQAGLDLNADGAGIGSDANGATTNDNANGATNDDDANSPSIQPDIIRNPSEMARDHEQSELRSRLRTTEQLLAAGMSWLDKERAQSAGVLEDAKAEFDRLDRLAETHQLGREELGQVSELADLSLRTLQRALADQYYVNTPLPPPPSPPMTILPWEDQTN
ncbi:MAG: adenylate kinase [Watsoniomyces obsoletus]|nr:MAG: adenylate kinase [Watsoniomyces obsoletus]